MRIDVKLFAAPHGRAAAWALALAVLTLAAAPSSTAVAQGSSAPSPGAPPDVAAVEPEETSVGTAVEPEETPVGTQIAWVLEILNLRAGAITDAELTDRLSPRLTAAFPPAELRAPVREWAANGPFTYLGYTRAPTDTQAVALLLDKRGLPFALPLAIDAAPPGRITGMNLIPVPPPPGVEVHAYSAEAEPDRQDGLVDLDGRSIYMSCHGSGGPTVLLESGLDDPAAGWFGVESAVAEFTRVCSYDRPNTPAGASDPAPASRTGQDAADDLHTLLQTAGEEEPVVLAAHSIGGQVARLYAAAHPESVAGLVLVDATHEDLYPRLAELVGPELREEVERELAAAPNAEGLDLGATAQQVRAARAERPLPPLPLVVLTRGLPYDPAVAETQLWRDLQADLVTLVPGAQQVLAERSGHYIHQSQPELVVDAIRGVVTAAREGQTDETMPPSGSCTPS
jgi:pimeloyl-ACP methyl ester carboxylesterase